MATTVQPLVLVYMTPMVMARVPVMEKAGVVSKMAHLVEKVASLVQRVGLVSHVCKTPPICLPS